MATLFILMLLGAVVANTLLLYSLIRRPDRNGVVISFVVFLFSINIWAIPQLLINSFGLRGDLFSFINKISSFGYVFIPVSFLAFAYSYTNKLEDFKKFSSLAIIFIPAFIFLFISLTTNLLIVHRPENMLQSDWGFAAPTGLLFPAFLIWLETLMIYSLFKIVSYIGESGESIKRRQALLIVFALLIPLSVGTFTDGVLPIIGFNPIPMAVPLTTITAIIIGYAINKYELFDLSASTILSTLGEGVITVNEKGRIIMMNQSAESMLGVKSKEMIGQIYHRKVRLLDQTGHSVSEKDRPISKVLRSKRKTYFKNYFIVPRNNKKFSVAFTISPILRGRKLIGVTVNFRDNSKEQEIEQNKDDFISIASHELKTPITALKLYTQLLEREVDGKGDHRQTVNKINKQTDRLMSLIGDLLNVSRIQTGKVEYNKKDFSIEDLIDGVLVSIKPILTGRKITRRGKVKEKVYGDMEKLSQVLTNLLTNAIKYSPKDTPIVLTTSTTKGKAVVSVKDYGAGIPKKDQDKIFDRLYQGRVNQKKQGLGVGLYLSQEIIKNHEGELFVKSQKGRGSTFYFTLPLHKA